MHSPIKGKASNWQEVGAVSATPLRGSCLQSRLMRRYQFTKKNKFWRINMNYNAEKNNKVYLYGEIVSEAQFSHEVYGEGFYE